MATRRDYSIPIESFEKALIKMDFYKIKTTPMTVHYRRADGLHVVLGSRAKKKGRPSRKVGRDVGKGTKTMVKVHRDDLITHKVIKLRAYERRKFLSELSSLAQSFYIKSTQKR